MYAKQFFLLATLACVLASAIGYCQNGILSNNFDENAKRAFLDLHNHYRTMAANGQIPNQPRATNMVNLTWDDTLARQAQEISDTCVYGHVTVNNPSYWWVGQNIANLYDSRPNTNFETKPVDMWFDEYKLYTYSNHFSYEAGHYTQIVWAKTTHVGCAATAYKGTNGWYERFYVCNYGPGGNMEGEFPYET